MCAWMPMWILIHFADGQYRIEIKSTFVDRIWTNIYIQSEVTSVPTFSHVWHLSSLLCFGFNSWAFDMLMLHSIYHTQPCLKSQTIWWIRSSFLFLENSPIFALVNQFFFAHFFRNLNRRSTFMNEIDVSRPKKNIKIIKLQTVNHIRKKTINDKLLLLVFIEIVYLVIECAMITWPTIWRYENGS